MKKNAIIVMMFVSIILLTACDETVGEKLETNNNNNMPGEVSQILEFDSEPVYEFAERKRRDSTAIVQFADVDEVTMVLPREEWNKEVVVSENVEVKEDNGFIYLIFNGNDDFEVQFPETLETKGGNWIDLLKVKIYERNFERNK